LQTLNNLELGSIHRNFWQNILGPLNYATKVDKFSDGLISLLSPPTAIWLVALDFFRLPLPVIRPEPARAPCCVERAGTRRATVQGGTGGLFSLEPSASLETEHGFVGEVKCK